MGQNTVIEPFDKTSKHWAQIEVNVTHNQVTKEIWLKLV
jgi:hypothetical protein